jgi:hypothetical protein
MLGETWVQCSDEWGRRRIDREQDLVRREVATALRASGVTVIPILLKTAKLPPADALPKDLDQLVSRHLLPLADEHFDRDAREIAEHLRDLGIEPHAESVRRPQATGATESVIER